MAMSGLRLRWRGGMVSAVLLAVVGGVLPGVAPAAEVLDSPVRRWNLELLDAIRAERPGPTVAARALAVLHTCLYDAWALYDEVAVGTTGAARVPKAERAAAHGREALEHAGHHAAVDLFPARAARFDEALAAAAPERPGLAARRGRDACRRVLNSRHRDGSNQLGDDPRGDGRPFSDTSGYAPVNTPDELRDPARWQPLRVLGGDGQPKVQRFLTPHWQNVTPFAVRPDQLVVPGPAAPGSAAFESQAADLIALSAGLSDTEKVIAEFWAGNPGTELPPGHWMLLAQFCARRDNHTTERDVKLFFVVANALLDASIASWKSKVDHDYVRPITLVRHLYAGQRIEAWAGPHRGTGKIDGANWTPYLPTPPFAEHVSGHSTFSAAAAESMRLFTGSERLGAKVVIRAGSSTIEPGTTPADDVTLTWATFSEAAEQAGLSRRYGGIHFENADLAGRALGRQVAAAVWARSLRYFSGLG